MRFTLLALALLLPLMVAAQDISKVNGNASVDAGAHAGNLQSVNGSVEVGSGAVVQDAGTVNGSVNLGDHAQASTLRTVNGQISLARDSRVGGGVKSVNGDISLRPGADVAGSLSNVNGTISLDHAHVAQGIETTDGDITVGEGSRVEGGILVNEINSHSHGWNNRKPRIVIGPHAIVQGTLEFRREVELQVSSTAQIGPVKGATPVSFSGSAP
jgi:hypothetical protein